MNNMQTNKIFKKDKIYTFFVLYSFLVILAHKLNKGKILRPAGFRMTKHKKIEQ